MAIPLNPYVTGHPVGDTSAFVGRTDMLRQVLHILSRPKDNAIILYGQRRIGKTSILQHLAAQLPGEGPYLPVEFDLENKAEWPLGRLLQDLACTIADALGQPDPDLGSQPETALRQEWLPTVLDDLPNGSSLVLLFDEFDVLAGSERKEPARAFFSYLHTLLSVDPGRLQFVFVIGRNVDDLDSIALSLFKSVHARRVSLLGRNDTGVLVRLSEANGTLDWSDEAEERVWVLTCGHPYLTQQLCSHVWHRAYDEEGVESNGPPSVAATDVDAAVPDALEASRNMLEWLWDGLPPAERVVASVLAEAGPGLIDWEKLEELLSESGVRVVIRELQIAPQLLQEWDLIEPVENAYRFRVELLRRWIVEHKSLQLVQKELDRIEPVAESLFRAAWGLYTSGDLDQAIAPLRQAVRLNPNHVGANQVLAEILLVQEQVGEARQVLERLYEYQPRTARPRLVQAVLAQAQAAETEDEQLALYKYVLDLEPAQREASNRVSEIQRERRRRDLAVKLGVLKELEQEKHYKSALDLAHELATEYAEMREWTPDLRRLKHRVHIDNLYQQALGALQSGDRETAKVLLAQVVAEEPEYEDAAFFLHRAVAGADVDQLQQESRGREPVYTRVPWYLIVSGLLLIFSIILMIWTSVRFGSLSGPAISGFFINEPRQLGPVQEQASVSGYLEYSAKMPISDVEIAVYSTGVKLNREEKWRRSSMVCTTQVGRQWVLSAECTTFPTEYSEFSLVAILFTSDETSRLPSELVVGDLDELRSELSAYAYSCDDSTLCNSISPVFQVSRITAGPTTPTPTVTSSPTPSPTPTKSPTPRLLATSTPAPSRTTSPSPASSPTLTFTDTPTATLPLPTDTRSPSRATNTPTPTHTVPPPPTNTIPPPPTNTPPPPPTNTLPPPPTNTRSVSWFHMIRPGWV